jgi:hypothetical protein
MIDRRMYGYRRGGCLQVPRTVDLGPPRVAHFKRDRFHYYIGSPGPLGNPFIVGQDGTREEVIAKFALWLPTQPQLLDLMLALRGLTLGCWCTDPDPCHGHVLLRLANGPLPVSFAGLAA